MTNKQTESKKGQVERFADKLKEVKALVTEKDRLAAVDSLKLTPETISRYLNGKVANLDTAVDLLGFFNQRIEEREKLIA
jgi:hypothetical protein